MARRKGEDYEPLREVLVDPLSQLRGRGALPLHGDVQLTFGLRTVRDVEHRT
jgi:hypothetical protein